MRTRSVRHPRLHRPDQDRGLLRQKEEEERHADQTKHPQQSGANATNIFIFVLRLFRISFYGPALLNCVRGTQIGRETVFFANVYNIDPKCQC